MGCGSSKNTVAAGGRHTTAKHKEKEKTIERAKTVGKMEAKKALDREALLKSIFEMMDKDSNGHVDLCACQMPAARVRAAE